jgi:hypothetical protein
MRFSVLLSVFLGLRTTSFKIGSSSSFLRVPVDFEGGWPAIKIGYNSGAGSGAEVGGVTTLLGTGVGVFAGAVDLAAFRDFGVFMAPVDSTDASSTSKTSPSRGVRRVVLVVVLSVILGEVVVGGWCICQGEDR